MVIRYSSDQNLHDRRPGTSGNVLQQNRRLQMVASEESTAQAAVPPRYGLKKVPEDRNATVGNPQRKPPTQYMAGNSRGTSNHSKSFNSGKRYSNQMPPNQPATEYSVGSGQTAKRLLSNTGARKCVRGELLTNGYKSLRAQGMLRAAHTDGI